MSVDVQVVWFERDLRVDDQEPLDHELEGTGTRLVLRVGTMPAVLEFAAIAVRRTPEAKTIADEIVEGHGSRRPAPKRRAAEK